MDLDDMVSTNTGELRKYADEFDRFSHRSSDLCDLMKGLGSEDQVTAEQRLCKSTSRAGASLRKIADVLDTLNAKHGGDWMGKMLNEPMPLLPHGCDWSDRVVSKHPQ